MLTPHAIVLAFSTLVCGLVSGVNYREASPSRRKTCFRNSQPSSPPDLPALENALTGRTDIGPAFERVEIDEYPSVVLRELCVNMLAHRDYQAIHSAARAHAAGQTRH
jgi:hypothetical protein